MQVLRGLTSFDRLYNTAVTTGTFDGLHVGHRHILEQLVRSARSRGLSSVVLTFESHPRNILDKNDVVKLLSDPEEKTKLLAEMPIDHLVILPFNKEFSEISPERFVKDILVEKLGAKLLVVGYDHRFGKNREGNFEYLEENASKFGFEVEEIPKREIERAAVSSTKIRKALLQGDVRTAAKYLGRLYTLSGTVTEGNKMGRKLGFPTANIRVTDPNKLVPADGVYAVKVFLENKEYRGMMNIGIRPTFGGLNKTLEVHIFDFEDDIYGRVLTVAFVDRIRDEMKFSSPEALKEQLEKDREQTLRLLQNFKN